jgi:hypothetical protein
MSELAYFVPDGSNGPYFIPEYLRSDGTYNDDTWPSSAVLMTEEETKTYWKNAAPLGKTLGEKNGRPAWIDIPPLPNSELLKSALSKLSLEHQNDSESLNRAWLAAAVSDGAQETSKKDAVTAQIADRRAKYLADRAALIAQYPV